MNFMGKSMKFLGTTMNLMGKTMKSPQGPRLIGTSFSHVGLSKDGGSKAADLHGAGPSA